MARQPGQRRDEILQALATLLESPDSGKITTAALAARLDVSEAALYRHFASKAKMYEALIEFIEATLFGLVNKVQGEAPADRQVEQILSLLLGFASRNRGMARILIGDALVHEDARLQARVNQLLDRLEASLRQSLRIARPGADDHSERANILVCFVLGRWQQLVRSGFTRDPLDGWARTAPLLLP
ncbi:MAG: nucleoid occlusion factor SlmA [Betaproteobacteria bacterium]|jgi:TetR/AcrR family transcriptional regulator|nr:nucleoid occlusion factor SlmA [Betaproteobacteria bacterium]